MQRSPPHGTNRGSQLGLRAKCSRNKFAHCSLTFQRLLFDRESVSRVGMQARSGEVISRIRDIGRRSHSWRASTDFSSRTLTNPQVCSLDQNHVLGVLLETN